MDFWQNLFGCLHKGEKPPWQISSFLFSIPTTHLCFSHLKLPPPLHPHFACYLSPCWEVVLGYLLRDILHCAYCLNCLLRKEVGRNETATHSGFVMFLVSPCNFLLQNAASGQDLSTDTAGAQCCEICENVIFNSTLSMTLVQVFIY